MVLTIRKNKIYVRVIAADYRPPLGAEFFLSGLEVAIGRQSKENPNGYTFNKKSRVFTIPNTKRNYERILLLKQYYLESGANLNEESVNASQDNNKTEISEGRKSATYDVEEGSSNVVDEP